MTAMWIELIINGFVSGCLLGLIAIGYSLAYGTARIVNFAHADVMVMGGGYLLFMLVAPHGSVPRFASTGMSVAVGLSIFAVTQSWTAHLIRSPLGQCTAVVAGSTGALVIWLLAGKLSFWLATIVAVPATAFLASLVYVLVYAPLVDRAAKSSSIFLASLGSSVVIESLLLLMWGSQPLAFAPGTLPNTLVPHLPPNGTSTWHSIVDYGVLMFHGVVLTTRDAILIGVFILSVVGLGIFFRRSRTADAIIAVGDDRLAASACGIDPNRVLILTFFIGGAIASLGGTMLVLRSSTLTPTCGFSPGILAFVACVLGGIGDLRGSVIGSFLIGFTISLAPAIQLGTLVNRHMPHAIEKWLPSLNLGDWSYGIAYVVMIAVILVRPKGLFARC
jgi:branched-subunit amino acid ABC-type transport system permease component